MQKFASRFFLGVMLAGLALAGIASPVNAQSTAQACSPDLKPSQHVYQSRGMASGSNPVRLSGLEGQIADKEAANELQVFIVTCDASYSGGTTDPLAIDTSNALVDSMAKNPDISPNRYILIVAIRNADAPQHWLFAASVGKDLRDMGISVDDLNSWDGPVLRTVRHDFVQPPQPAFGFANMVDHFNDDIAAFKANQSRQAAEQQAAQQREAAEKEAAQAAAKQAAIDHAKTMAAMPMYLTLGTLLTIFLGFSIAWLMLRSAVAHKIEETRKKSQNCVSNNLELRSSYMDFLSGNGADWKNKFTGKTLQAYTVAFSQFADLQALIEAARVFMMGAEKTYKMSFFPNAIGLHMTMKALTKQEIKVSGDTIPIAERSLFQDSVSTSTYTPDSLFAKMDSLFKGTNEQLKGIMDSFHGAQTNADDINAEVKVIDGARGEMDKRGLPFTPYQPEYDKIASERQAFVDKLSADPMEAFDASKLVKTEADILLAETKRACELKDSLPAAQAEIDTTVKHTADQRAKPAGYAYPDDATAPEGHAAQFTLDESNGNPDVLIADANEALANSLKLLLAGKLEEAAAARALAVSKAQAGFQLVDAVVSAKAYIEKVVPQWHGDLAKLRAKIPPATTALAELKADFLEKNYDGQPDHVDFANRIADSTEAQLAKIRAAYYEQRYLSAQTLAQHTGEDIQNSRDGLVEVHSVLARLKQLRDRSRQTVKANLTYYDSLASKLHQNAFTTSARTDTEFAGKAPTLASQNKDVNQAITDWPAAVVAADQMTAHLKEIDAAIDQQKADFDRATNSVNNTLGQAVAEAAGYVRNTDTRQTARSKFDDAQHAFENLRSAMRVAKSDWASLARQTGEAITLANAAERLAQDDHEKADSARTAIAAASAAITNASVFSDEGQTPNLGYARASLASAASELSSKEYESAVTSAQQAVLQAQSAVSDARSRANRIREERAEAERRRQAAIAAAEESARRARESSNSGGGGFSGGGSSGGGGFSGGGSSGGGGI